MSNDIQSRAVKFTFYLSYFSSCLYVHIAARHVQSTASDPVYANKFMLKALFMHYPVAKKNIDGIKNNTDLKVKIHKASNTDCFVFTK